MTGAMLISASGDLLMLFLGLELMVLPGYLLAAFHKSDAYSTEGAIKYFLLGSFSSAIFLFGIAFIWGLTGTTQLDAIVETLAAIVAGHRAAVAGPGDGPRVPDDRRGVQDRGGAVPLLDARRVPGLADADHRLSLGRAEGRCVRADPAAVRRGARAAGRLVDAGRSIVLATATMTLGNLVALTQDNVKRMLAYSSIAHTGYMLVGLAAWAGDPQDRLDGIEALLFYARRLRVHEPGRLRGHRRAPEALRGHVQPRRRSPGWAGASRCWAS